MLRTVCGYIQSVRRAAARGLRRWHGLSGVLLLVAFTLAQAQTWQPVTDPDLVLTPGAPLYDPRSLTYKAEVTLANHSPAALTGQWRLVLDSTTKVPIGTDSFPDGCTPCFAFDAAVGLAPGASIQRLLEFERGRGAPRYTVHLEQLPPASSPPPTIAITSPADGSYLTAGDVLVRGSASGEAIRVQVNGVAATLEDDGFSAKLPLAEGANPLLAEVQDGSGRRATATVRVHRDTTAPTISAHLDPPANAAGWHRSDVTVTFLCSDQGSGVVHCPDPLTLTAEGQGQRVQGEARDALGNLRLTELSLNLDRSAPQLTLTAPAEGTPLGVSPATLSGSASDALSGLAAVSCDGHPGTLQAAGFTCTVTLTPGDSSHDVVLTDHAGNTASASITLTYDPPPRVIITSPASLITVGASPLTVSGTLDDPSASLSVNGAPVTAQQGHFSVAVQLKEGLNTIVARAVDAQGFEASDSIAVSLDATAPYVTIDSPKNDAVVLTDRVDVSGLVNDIVRGTVSAEEANVVVNGVTAEVANRSWLARGVLLAPGRNTLRVQAADAVGNVGEASIELTFDDDPGRHIAPASGDGQQGVIRAPLPAPLAVELIDGAGQPVANQPVVFRVVQGDGLLGETPDAPGERAIAVTSDADGLARAHWTLGSHAGVGNQRVRATAVGFAGEVLMHASALAKLGDKLGIIAGNNQRGAIAQPLPEPLVVAVTDDGANLVANARVRFDVVAGGGRFFDGSTHWETTSDNDGRASAQLILGPEPGLDVHRVSATLLDSALTQPVTAGFTASALVPAAAGDTRLYGVVLDNQDGPIANVSLRAETPEGQPLHREAVSDAQGQFRITELPAGPLHLIVDGSTADTATRKWPSLSLSLVTVSGADNPLSAPIYLVPLDLEHARQVGAEDVVYTLPEVPGFALTVKQGSVTFPDGSKEGALSVTVVNANKIPMPPPNAMQPQLIVTIQPHGARFDPPAPLSLPNVDGHPPGAQVELYSYDHDLEEFVTIGLGTVSEDGTVIASNPGVGVVKAGWHCGSVPGFGVCAHNCPVCAYCDKDCWCQPDTSQDPGTCLKCSEEGYPVVDDEETPPFPPDEPGDCKQAACRGGEPLLIPNDTDTPVETPCKICQGGAMVNSPDDPVPTASPSPETPVVWLSEVGSGEVGGRLYVDATASPYCAEVCEDGVQWYVIAGDFTYVPSTIIQIYTRIEVPPCPLTDVATEIILEIVEHERIHDKHWRELIDKYKAWIGMYAETREQCESVIDAIILTLDYDRRRLGEQEKNHCHADFRSQMQFAISCQDGVSVVTRTATPYPECSHVD